MISSITLLLLLHRPRISPEFAQMWGKVSGAIQSTYYARKTRREEMNRLLAKYKPIASEATSQQAFESAINRMCEEFKDSHFEFFSNEDQGYYLMDGLRHDPGKAMPEIGAWFKRTPNGYVVSMVLNDSAAAKANLRKGDRILTADGKPFTPIGSFREKTRSTVELEVARGNNKLTASIVVNSASALGMFLDA